MSVLRFTLSPDSVEKFHNAISCLGKFSESVTIEATRDHFVLTTLNSTNSAYASFTFSGSKSFLAYAYNPPRTNGVPKEKFSCKMYNKALFAVFKGRHVDPTREKDTGVERCEVNVEDGAGEIKSRFIIKMVCKHGVLKTHKLTFESVTPAHAFFDSASASNSWSISSKVLREFIDHFGPGTEQLDIYSDDGRVNFTSFTEKIMDGNDVLKQPLHTSISLETADFTDFMVEEKMHIIISVKDFKAIIIHAGVLSTKVSALYSTPQRPMQLKYIDDRGMTCEYILMTIGDYRGRSVTPAVGNARATAAKRSAPPPLNNVPQNRTSTMPPPSRSIAPSMVREASRSQVPRPSPPPPQPSYEHNPMFFTEADDDRRWDPANYDDDEEEMLGWDASADHDVAATTYKPSLQNNDTSTQSVNGRSRQQTQTIRLEPTQRISQIRGMFDD